MLADNIILLREKFPDVYKSVKAWTETAKDQKITVEETRDQLFTMKYTDNGKSVYIHSKYNPIREAESIIAKLSINEVIDGNSHVVFYGLGFGYHIEAFLHRFPMTSYSIIEPSLEALSKYLDKKLIKKILNSRLIFFQGGNQVEELFNKIIQTKDKKVVICELPSYLEIFNNDYNNFNASLKSIIKEQHSSLKTNYAFKKRWIINSVNNFKVVLETPNILFKAKEVFKNISAILVAAGPSLDFEIENIKRIKEDGTAYIFAVGSAINTLIHNNILPHAMCTYDPTEVNQIVFKKLNDNGISTIPMIFGSSVGFETLIQYPGPKYHMITNQDTISGYFLKYEDGSKPELIHDASTIAVVSMELLSKMGFQQIVLVGQNLGYLNGSNYASGIDYDFEIKENIVDTIGVSGEYIKTTESFLRMKKHLEHTIQSIKTKVINTTVGGAMIAGTEFIPLANLLEHELVQPAIDELAFNKIGKNCPYDLKYLQTQLTSLEGNFHQFTNLLRDIKSDLKKLKNEVYSQNDDLILNINQLMDKKIFELEKNDFYKIVVLPICRTEHGLLLNEITRIKGESSGAARTRLILKPTDNFIDLLFCEMELFNEIMTVLKNTIDKRVEI